MKCLLFFLLLLQCYFGVAQSHDSDIAIIRGNRVASNEAIARHDVNGIAHYWLNDFVQVTGRGSYQAGKDSILTLWKTLFSSNPQVSYIRNPEEIIISENDTMAWEKGKWIGIHSYSKGGSYAAMWIKKNGMWMLQSELFVSLYMNKQ